MSRGRLLLWLWLVASLAWIGAIAYLCARGAPYLPLDVSANDPATRAAYDERSPAISCAARSSV